MKLRKVFRLNVSKTVLLDGIFMRYFKHNKGHDEAILSTVMQFISNFIREIILTNIYISMPFQYLMCNRTDIKKDKINVNNI